ncbi:MAG TPA: hypothetical protein VF802_03285, partial [Candidatus Limnocylindrales bacterium]
MDRIVDVAGHARLVLLDPPPSVVQAVARRFDPYPLVPATRTTVEAGAPDVILEAVPASAPRPRFVEVLGDTGDGLVTAWDGASLHLLAGACSCELPRIGEAGPLRLRYRPDFPVWSILGPVLGPILHGVVRERGGAVVHGSAVEVDGEAVLLAGWSESGKTEVALALAAGGAPLLSDKWTVLAPGDGTVASTDVGVLPFPSPLSVRRWVIDALPELRGALPAVARVQFAGAAAVSPVAAALRVREHPARGPVEALLLGALEGALDLGERASVPVSRLRRLGLAADAPTRERRLRAVVLLQAKPTDAGTATDGRGSGPLRSAPLRSAPLRSVDRRWAARRLARSAEAERRTWIDLLGRMAYAAEQRPVDDASGGASGGASGDPGRTELWQPAAVRAADEERLASMLTGIPIVEIAAPFPGDPRRLADAIRQSLSGMTARGETEMPVAAGDRRPRP